MLKRLNILFIALSLIMIISIIIISFLIFSPDKFKKKIFRQAQDKINGISDDLKTTATDDDHTSMICRLMGKAKTETIDGNIWEGDLGISFNHNQQLYILTGDTGTGDTFAPNAMAYSNDTDASDCLDFNWSTKPNGAPQNFFPFIDPDSTVPGGAISHNGTMYVFMMDVLRWDDPVMARSLLIKSDDDGKNFSLVWKDERDSKFINISPVLAEHPSIPNQQVVYLIASGKYRESPVYLAYAEVEDIEDKSKYHYYTGLENGLPQWSNQENRAVPVVNKVKVGELSVQWNSYLNQWLLAFFDYNSKNMYFRTADNLWGEWSGPKLVISGSVKYDWYGTRTNRLGQEIDWSKPYAPYLLPDEYNQDEKVYYIMSLWVPYSIFLMETDLSKFDI